MAKIQWDKTGERIYETGIDRGVLYLPNTLGVPWNGLTSIAEQMTGDVTTPYFVDGIKVSDIHTVGDYVGTLNALTYPEEFEQFQGVTGVGNGLYTTNQRPKPFHISYRTMIGNDLEDLEYAYKIHILYNLTATPAVKANSTITESVSPTEFSWTLAGTPEKLGGYRPTAHIILDTRYLNRFLVSDLEDILYGDEVRVPRLPPLSELADYITEWRLITITDHGDETWSATGPDDLITMMTSTWFRIDEVDATYLDEDTYNVSTTQF